MLVIEKRRFNRIEVSLGASVIPVDMNLQVVSGSPESIVHILDLSPIGMRLVSPQLLRAGARFRVTLKLPERPIQVYCLVKHTNDLDNGTPFKFGAGLQIVGATQDAVLTLVRFLATVAKAKDIATNATEDRRKLPPAA